MNFYANNSVNKLVEVISIEYGVSDSSTIEPSSYSPTQPALTQGKWLWIKTTYTNGEESISKSYMGEDGDNANVFDLSLSAQTYNKNLRDTEPTIVDVTVSLQGEYSAGTVSIMDENGNYLSYIVEKNSTAITPTYTQNVSDGDVLTLSIPKSVSYNVNVVMLSSTPVGSISKSIDCIDITVYNLNYGAINSLSGFTPVIGDYFVASANFSTFVASHPYMYTANGWTEITISSANANMLMELVSSATSSGVTIDQTNNALWTWCLNFVSENAVIANLFSQAITILNNGYIKSENYTPSSTYNNCEYDISNVDCERSFSVNADTFVNNTWGYGTYTIVCTSTYKSNPQSTEGTDDGTWSISLNGVQKATAQSCDGLHTYGIDIDFDGESYVTVEDDYFTITSSKQNISGQGFYLGSDGSFDCHNATMQNLAISGDSFFHGTLNTKVLKTILANPQEVPSGGIQGGVSLNQAKNITTTLKSNSYPKSPSYSHFTQLIPANLPDYPNSGVSYVAYYNESGSTYYALAFFDSSYNQINVNQMGLTLVGSSNTYNYIWTSGNSGLYFAENPVIKVYQGGEDAIHVDVPSANVEGITAVPISSIIAGEEVYYGNNKYRPLWVRTS